LAGAPLRAPCHTSVTERRRSRNRSAGQSVVEFTIFFPVFLLLLVAAIDLGRLFFSKIELDNAAREGAAYAASKPTDSAGILVVVAQETNSQAQTGPGAMAAPTVICKDPSGTTISCANASGGTGSGNAVTVSLSQPFTFFTPLINGLFGNNFKIGASASSTVLGYAASTTTTPPPTNCPLPTATFTYVVSGLTLTTDPSSSTPNSGLCNISGYNWDWGDGNSDVGAASATVHTYLGAGTYSVSLTTTNQAGETTGTQNINVGVAPPPTCTVPTASFTYTSSSKTFTFTDTSSVADPVNCPILSWAWTFGDGGASNVQNPTYTYGSANQHTVTLIVTNSAGPSAPYSHKQ
jgi:PKD repeat protein